MKYLLSVLLLFSLVAYGQYFSLDDLLSLRDLKSAQSFMLKKGLRFVSSENNEKYQEITNCSDNKNDCKWKCTSMTSNLTPSLSEAEDNYKHYAKYFWDEFTFAANYSSSEKTATSWINVEIHKASTNANCNAIFEESDNDMTIEMTLYDDNEYRFLRDAITEKGSFHGIFGETAMYHIDSRNFVLQFKDYDNGGGYISIKRSVSK